MKAFAALVLASIIVFASVIALPTLAYGETSVGVKKGDWIEYTIAIMGPPLEPIRNLTWYRAEVLEVDGAWFQVNKTALSVNGVLSSSIWSFNLAEGQVRGWVIIPANLSTGDTFFDTSKSLNITIEGEEQKTVLGANRAVTHASDPGKVYLEWDKATGVYVHSMAHTSNYTVIINAFATNMWGLQRAPFPTALVAVFVSTMAIVGIGLFVYFKKRARKANVTLESALLSTEISAMYWNAPKRKRGFWINALD